MRVVKEYKEGEFVYDNTKNSNHRQTLKIDDYELIIDFQDLIDTQFTCGNISEKIEDIKSMLGLGKYSKASCGGFINFYRLKESNCNYIIYSGVNEVSNSHYIVSLHKIFEE